MQITLPTQHNPWMANGIETLYRLIKDLEGCHAEIYRDHVEISIQDKEVFLRNFRDKVNSMQDLVIFCTKKDENGQKRYIRKDFILIQYGKAQDRNILKEKIFLDTEERLNDIFSKLESGNRICVLCGRSFKERVDSLKQAVYPFATKIRSLSGVRKMMDNYPNICPLCYLVGTLEWLDEGIVYRSFLGPASRRYSVVFLPFEMNLKKLNEAKERYIGNLKGENQQGSNVLKIVLTKEGEKLIPTEGENTTALKFFESFIDNIVGEFKIEQTDFEKLFGTVERTFCKQWSMLTIPSGTVKNIKYKSLVLEDEVLRLLVELQRHGIRVYSHIIEKLAVKTREGSTAFDDTDDLRENAAKFVLEDDFRKFSRILLPKKKKTVFFGDIESLDRLVDFWRLRRMNLEQELDNLKGAGRALAKLIAQHISILYSLDKAKTKAEFLRAFEQASKRLVGLKEEERREIFPLPLEEVTDLILKSDENEWKMIRDALIIYTSISYSRDRYLGSKEQEGDKK